MKTWMKGKLERQIRKAIEPLCGRSLSDSEIVNIAAFALLFTLEVLKKRKEQIDEEQNRI